MQPCVLFAFVLAVLVSASHVTAVQVEFVPVVDGSTMTYQQFSEQYMQTRTPVVFRNFMQKSFTKFGDNPREYIQKTCGHKPIFRKCPNEEAEEEEHSVNELDEALRGEAWGSLRSTDLDKFDIRTIGDMMREQERRRSKPELPQIYLHDASVDQLCPELLDSITIPRFFPYDFFSWFRSRRLSYCTRGAMFPGLHPVAGSERPQPRQLRPRSDHPDDHDLGYQWPSLFIGPNGTQSSLHTDSSGTTFWMAVIDGTKWWRIFREDQGPHLAPQSILEIDEYRRVYGRFAVDIFKPDYERFPELRLARGWEINLTRGDLLYIPAGAPHAVKNVGDTIAYSYNLVDQDNLEYHFAVDFTEHLEQARDQANEVQVDTPNGVKFLDDDDEEYYDEEAEAPSNAAEKTQDAKSDEPGHDEQRRDASPSNDDGGEEEENEEEEVEQVYIFPPMQHRAPTLGRVCTDPDGCEFGPYYDSDGDMVGFEVNWEEHPITFLLYFLKYNATIPLPDKDYETLGEYVARQYPPTYMKLPENQAAWKRSGVPMTFDEFFQHCSEGDREPEILAADVYQEFVDFLVEGRMKQLEEEKAALGEPAGEQPEQ